jgi:uncharacterized protein involved in exopolysaccharide biosynthesis
MENQEFIKKRNPIDYLKVFFRRKWLFIAPTFAGLILGIMACFTIPPKYESKTIILVEEEKIINPLIQNLAVSSTAAQRMQNIREIILGWNSLVELTQKLGLAKDIKSQIEYEGFIKGLREAISVRMRQSNIIEIGYLGTEPAQTQLVAQTLTDILMEKNLASQTKETDVAITFIQEQLEIYKRKIKESEIAKIEEELKNLLVDSTEQHPMVKDLRQKIAAAKKELESGEFQITGIEKPVNDATQEALKKELDKIIEKETQAKPLPGSTAYARETIDDANASIYKLLLIDKVGNSHAQDIDVNKRIYQMLLERLETAKITQRLEASKEGTRYTIIEPPRLPLAPTKPNKIKVIFLGMILGGFAGTGLVFGREFLDQSFLDIEDAKGNLNLPILGAISRITTQEEIEEEKYKEKKWIIIALLSAATLVIITMLLSLLKH